jgi:HK97 family phage major capsid protein
VKHQTAARLRAGASPLALETKDAGSGSVVLEVRQMQDKILGILQDERKANDDRLKGIEKRFDDVVTQERLKRIQDAFDEHKSALDARLVEMQRAARAEAKADGQDRDQRLKDLRDFERGAQDLWFRKGDASLIYKSAAEAERLELKDMTSVVASDGGYMVMPEQEAEFLDIVLEMSPMRDICRVTNIGTRELEIPVNRKGLNVAWIGELQTRTATNTPTLSKRKFTAHELYAYPTVTKALLEDAMFDVEAFIFEEGAEAFAQEENRCFVEGTGVEQPRGFLTHSTTAVGSYTATIWDSLSVRGTGASGAFATPTTTTGAADALINLVFDLKPIYRSAATWVMNRRVQAAVRLLKDVDGRYLTETHGGINGTPLYTSLLGFPIVEMDEMPDIGAGTLSVALGDFARGYQIVDRIGVEIDRDDKTAPGFVKFPMRRRVGGDVRDFHAIKLLQFS